MMKSILLKSAILTACIFAALDRAPQAAFAGGIGNNYIGPSVSFGNGSTVFGIDSKLGVADNLSLRPYVTFPSGGTTFGTSLTYDWDLRKSSLPITPFIGLGINFNSGNNNTQTTGFAQIGTDLDVSENISLLGSVQIPFNSGYSTTVTIGSGLRF
jgi:opacity protein-like surface antigen